MVNLQHGCLAQVMELGQSGNRTVAVREKGKRRYLGTITYKPGGRGETGLKTHECLVVKVHPIVYVRSNRHRRDSYTRPCVDNASSEQWLTRKNPTEFIDEKKTLLDLRVYFYVF